MDAKIKEAEERLRNPTGRDANGALNSWWPIQLADMTTLVNAWLAEHHADDDEPATLDDLEAAFANSDVVPSVRNGVIGARIDTYIEIKTRGDLRRLALGIQLK